jgi:hypothetical protein
MLMLMRLELLLLFLLGLNHLVPRSVVIVVVAAANNENTNCSTISEIVCQTEGFGTSTCNHDIASGVVFCTVDIVFSSCPSFWFFLLLLLLLLLICLRSTFSDHFLHHRFATQNTQTNTLFLLCVDTFSFQSCCLLRN